MAIDQKLLDGNKEYKEKYYGEDGLMLDLAENGQKPKYVFIACTDSRNDPAIVFQLDPGDAFGYRQMGPLLEEYDPNDSASVQFNSHIGFYVNAYETPKAYIMGHTKCGAAAALADDINHDDITPWLIPAGQKALNRTKEKMGELPEDKEGRTSFLRELEEQMIIVNREHLLSYPKAKAAYEAGKLEIPTILNEIETGNLYELNPKDNSFFLANDQDTFEIGCGCSHENNNE